MNLRHLLRQHICKDVDRIRLGFRSRSCSEQDLQQCNLMVSEKGVSDEASTKYAALAELNGVSKTPKNTNIGNCD